MKRVNCKDYTFTTFVDLFNKDEAESRVSQNPTGAQANRRKPSTEVYDAKHKAGLKGDVMERNTIHSIDTDREISEIAICIEPEVQDILRCPTCGHEETPGEAEWTNCDIALLIIFFVLMLWICACIVAWRVSKRKHSCYKCSTPLQQTYKLHLNL